MDMPSVIGAPRHCYIGGNVYLVRPMTVLGLATVMQWLDDVLPGRADRKMPPKIGGEASQNALRSFPGQVMQAWLALREHGFTYAQAEAIVPHYPEDDGNDKKALEHLLLMEVFLSRRRTMGKIEGGQDWSETWLEKGHAQLAREFGLAAIGDLTLDQYEWLCSGGEADADEQYDLQTIVANFESSTLPKIKEAIASGTMEVISPNGN